MEELEEPPLPSGAALLQPSPGHKWLPDPPPAPQPPAPLALDLLGGGGGVLVSVCLGDFGGRATGHRGRWRLEGAEMDPPHTLGLAPYVWGVVAPTWLGPGLFLG